MPQPRFIGLLLTFVFAYCVGSLFSNFGPEMALRIFSLYGPPVALLVSATCVGAVTGMIFLWALGPSVRLWPRVWPLVLVTGVLAHPSQCALGEFLSSMSNALVVPAVCVLWFALPYAFGRMARALPAMTAKVPRVNPVHLRAMAWFASAVIAAQTLAWVVVGRDSLLGVASTAMPVVVADLHAQGLLKQGPPSFTFVMSDDFADTLAGKAAEQLQQQLVPYGARLMRKTVGQKFDDAMLMQCDCLLFSHQVEYSTPVLAKIEWRAVCGSECGYGYETYAVFLMGRWFTVSTKPSWIA